MPRHRHVGRPAGHLAKDDPPAMPDPVRDPTVSAAAAREARRPSRRAVLRGAAGAGAASVAATALAGLGGTAVAAQGTPGTRKSRAADASARTDGTAQIVVHVKDAADGHIDIFRDTTLIRLRDPELAARLVRASRA